MNHNIFNFAFVFGLAFTLIGIIILLSQFIVMLRCTEQTQGLVVRGKFIENEAALMLTFTVDEQYYRIPFSHSDKISEGDTVTVAYNPVKITQNTIYIVDDTADTRIMGIIAIIAGIISMLIGYGVYIGLFTEVWKI